MAALAGSLPRAHEFALYSGWPSLGIAGAALAALVNGVGEETGWRGFLLPSLQPRYGAPKVAVIVGAFWALWHLPYFFLLSSDHGMAPFGYVGFAIAIISGSIVATWLYYGSGQSVLAVAVWHGAFNMAAGTAASSGLVATVASMLIIVQAVLLVRWQARATQRRRPPVLGPPVTAGGIGS